VTREPNPAASIQEQAFHWWELFHGEAASSSDHREFAEWVARSPERVEAYLQTARLLQVLKSPQVQWPTTSAAELIHASKTSPREALPLSPGAAPAGRATVRREHVFHLRLALGVAATLLLGLGVAWWRVERPQEFTTAIGEQRSILLEDGTRVMLNTRSKLEVRLRKDQRSVRLIEGEALFDVAHDATRPFKVRASGAAFTDVGTQFNVDMRPSETTVTVIEGQVAVAEEGATQESLLLAAADSVVITRGRAGTPQHGTNVTAAIAWTQRQLMFERRPLSEVAAEFNRYNRERIVIESIELQGQEVTGVFQAKDPTSFLDFLSNIPGVEVREGPDGAHIVAFHKNAVTR
jgi:transmembrane sensor